MSSSGTSSAMTGPCPAFSCPRAVAPALLANGPKLLIVSTRLRQGHVLLGRAPLASEVFNKEMAAMHTEKTALPVHLPV